MKIVLYILLIISTVLTQDDTQIYEIEGVSYAYKRPSFSEVFTQVPQAYSDFYGHMISQDYLLANVLMVSSTAILIYYDQAIYDSWSKYGRDIGIGNGDNTKTFLKVGGLPIFRGPTDVGSTMYFIGDGWFHISIALSFYGYGSFNDDNRALQTAMQIGNGMLTAGIFTQTLKHITGRETPSHATQDAGYWDWFPNQKDYHKKVPKYDAFPSGHLATAMMTLTVIAENYSEYKYIYPIGIGMMTLLSYQMVNNGVHWASDYPLALLAGYLFGKVAVDNNRKRLTPEEQSSVNYSFSPAIVQGNPALGLKIEF